MIEAVYQVVCDGWCHKILGRFGGGTYAAVHYWDDAALSFRTYGAAYKALLGADWLLTSADAISLVYCPDCQLTLKS